MVTKLTELLTALDKLIQELLSSGKQGPADFFIKKAAELQSPATAELAVEALSTCRAMAQYGNFSLAEEGLLDDVVDATAGF